MIVVDDVPAEFASRVVQAFRARLGELFSIALSGGDTARACYERLAQEGSEAIDWLSVNVYWGDERCVAPDDPDSNQLLGRKALLERVGAANAVYPMNCQEGPDAYQLRLGSVERLDLIHLGLGPDGHTASLFPGSTALESDPGQLVVMTEDPTGRNRLARMTLSLSGIARSKEVIFTVSGESKREALTAILAGADLPAARVKSDKITWIVDHEALGS
jgi:6-phosphogluconolactonase